MSEPDWAEIVKVMYHQDPPSVQIENQGEQEIFTTRWLAENMSLSKEQVDRTTADMKRWGLVEKRGVNIEGEDGSDAKVNFSKDGFEVAHQRELNEKNQRVNESLVFFTFALVLAQLIAVVPLKEIYKVMAVLALLGGLLVWLWLDRKREIGQ